MTMTASLILGGQRVAGEAGSLSVTDPATGDVFARAQAASAAQLERAVAEASQAFVSWSRRSLAERRDALNAIADSIDAHAAELAELVVREQGKPLALAQVEVGGAAAWTRATASLEPPTEVIEDSPAKRIELRRRPVGVVGSITPWNWPLLIAAWHYMPALLAGNTVVAKPSELTPLATSRLIELMNDALPSGVINSVVGGAELGRNMACHPRIGKLVFTGSTATGQEIMRNGAANLKRLTHELGGNDAAIVLPNADLDAIAPALFATAFLNMGQTCAALKRLYVHESQYQALCERLVAIAHTQVLGSGLEASTTLGPVQNPRQLERIIELVDDARACGARILCGGEPLRGKGYFYPPTIVADIAEDARLVQEEQFGPVLPVLSYVYIDDAVTRANAVPFGLGGSVWGNDVAHALAVAERLECGTVWINGHAEVLPHCPFGGCKLSGFGVEFGLDGLLEYTVPQLVNISRG